MLSRNLKSVVLLATAFGLVPSVYAQIAGPSAKPVTWVCSKLSEVVDPESPAYGEKFSTVYVADIYADGTCDVMSSVAGAPIWTGPDGVAQAAACSWERTDELGSYSGRLSITWREGDTFDYPYVRISEDRMVVGAAEQVGSVGNAICERQTYNGRIRGR